MKKGGRWVAFCLGLVLCFGNVLVFAEPSTQVDTEVSTQLVKGEAGILMEAKTGEVLYEWNPDNKHQIASVTKTMTMLLIMEALADGKIKKEDTEEDAGKTKDEKEESEGQKKADDKKESEAEKKPADEKTNEAEKTSESAE